MLLCYIGKSFDTISLSARLDLQLSGPFQHFCIHSIILSSFSLLFFFCQNNTEITH